MRQTWYEAAKKNLRQEERTAFYEACFEYEFYAKIPDRETCPFGSVLMLFDMVRDDLTHDVEKSNRIAERNRRNGMLGGRPARENPNGTEDNPTNPVGSSGLPLYNYNNNNNNKKKSSSFSIPHKNTQKYENFLFLLIFFQRGCGDPFQERERFVNYYQARGWNVSKDMPAVDKVALAKSWKPQDMDEIRRSNRATWCSILRGIDAEDDCLIAEYEDMRQGASEWRIKLSGLEAYNLLESKYLRGMYELLPKGEDGKPTVQVSYTLPNTNQDE